MARELKKAVPSDPAARSGGEVAERVRSILADVR